MSFPRDYGSVDLEWGPSIWLKIPSAELHGYLGSSQPAPSCHAGLQVGSAFPQPLFPASFTLEGGRWCLLDPWLTSHFSDVLWEQSKSFLMQRPGRRSSGVQTVGPDRLVQIPTPLWPAESPSPWASSSASRFLACKMGMLMFLATTLEGRCEDLRIWKY